MTFTKEQREQKRVAQEKKDAERKARIEPLLVIARKQLKIENDVAYQILRSNEKPYLDAIKQVIDGEKSYEGSRYYKEKESLTPLTENTVRTLEGLKKELDVLLLDIKKQDKTEFESKEEATQSLILWRVKDITRHLEYLVEFSVQMKLLVRVKQLAISKIYDIGRPKVGLNYSDHYPLSDSDFDSDEKPNEKIQKLLDNAKEVKN